VTDVGALIAYIESMHVPELEQSQDAQQLLRSLIHEEMVRNHGVFRIQKESGLFLARA
jgi:hypothetical protein